MNMNGGRALKVLLADDEATIVRIYSVGLPAFFASRDQDSADELEAELFGASDDKKPAADLTICRQGDEAVENVRRALDEGSPYDVVVLDIRMPPGINGVEAAKQIRSMDENVKILFVSAYSDFRLQDLCESVPPPSHMDYMKKPVQLSDLASRIIDFSQPTST